MYTIVLPLLGVTVPEKSSLLKILADELDITAANVSVAPNVRVLLAARNAQ